MLQASSYNSMSLDNFWLTILNGDTFIGPTLKVGVEYEAEFRRQHY